MGTTALSTFSQFGAIGAQSVYSSRMADINIRRSQMQAKDALDRGADQADKYGKNVEKLIGTQKVNAAGQGIDVASGSAADLIKETGELGYKDVQQIQTNAFREALGYGLQSADYAANKIVDRSAAQTRQTATLLNGLVTGARFAAGSFGSSGKSDPNYDFTGNQNAINSIDTQLKF